MNHTEGIILSSASRREADAVFKIYTKELGLVDFQAKSVKKAQAKLKFNLQPFNRATIYFVPARYLPIIVDAKVENNFAVIKNDLERLKLAGAVGHVLRNIFEPNWPDYRSWQKITAYFDSLNNPAVGADKISNLTCLMCYQLLWLGGFDPELARCTVCLKPIFRGRLNISLINGGLVHTNCAYAEVSLSVNREVLYLVNDMKKTDPRAVLSQELNSDVWNDFRKLTQFFFQYYFGLDIGELI